MTDKDLFGLLDALTTHPEAVVRHTVANAKDRIEALSAEVERLRRVIKHWPTRADYDNDKSFIDAHFNYETLQARAALEPKP